MSFSFGKMMEVYDDSVPFRALIDIDLFCTCVDYSPWTDWNYIIAGSFKSQLIDYFRGCIVSWEKVEGSIWQFYDN